MSWIKSGIEDGNGRESETHPVFSPIRRTIPGGGRLSVRHRQKGERSLWPRRFWEYAICDEGDYEPRVDYLHYNPAKPGQVMRVADWPHSNFHRCIRCGIYKSRVGAR